MLMNPKVSIIMPVYNAADHLRDSLDSVLGQSYKDLEIICVDDGSTDESLSILRKYAETDLRISIIRQENQYAGIARNKGLAHACGDYVMFLDSDDIFEKNMVSYLVKKAAEYDTDIVVFGYWRFITSMSKRRPVRNHYKNGLLCSSRDIKDNIFQVTRSLPWDKFIRMDFVRKTGLQYQGIKVNNDIFFNRTLVTEANRMLFSGKRFVNYRINNENSLQGKLSKNPTDFIRANEGIYNELKKRKTLAVFKDSFDRIVLSDVILHLQRVNSYEEYEAIVNRLIECGFWSSLDLSKDCKAVSEHPYKEMIELLLSGETLKSFFCLYTKLRENSVGKDSFEYTIGHGIMELFRLTY